MHKVVVDRSHAVVSVTAQGFFTERDLAAAAADLHAAIRSLGSRAGQHVTLFDLTSLHVAPPALIDQFARFHTDPAIAPLWARRVALVSRSALVTQQLERVSRAREGMRVFADRREALAWLLADQNRLRVTSQPTAASG